MQNAAGRSRNRNRQKRQRESRAGPSVSAKQLQSRPGALFFCIFLLDKQVRSDCGRTGICVAGGLVAWEIGDCRIGNMKTSLL